jgi:hypothetical protein
MPLPTTAHLKDLGVIRSDLKHYNEHIVCVSADCRRLCGAIVRAFRSRNPDLMWMAYRTYVLPKLMYASSAWCPVLKQDIQTVESVQRRFTKAIYNYGSMSYDDRLRALKALSLEDMRVISDLIFLYKCIKHEYNIELDELGVSQSANNARSRHTRLEQLRPANLAARSLYKYRVPKLWNEHVARTNSITMSVGQFRKTLTERLLCKSTFEFV